MALGRFTSLVFTWQSVRQSRGNPRGGIGRLLLQALVDAARECGHHALLARVSSDNTASIDLHARLGFLVVGTLKEVGVKFDRVLDVTIMELLLPD